MSVGCMLCGGMVVMFWMIFCVVFEVLIVWWCVLVMIVLVCGCGVGFFVECLVGFLLGVFMRIYFFM